MGSRHAGAVIAFPSVPTVSASRRARLDKLAHRLANVPKDLAAVIRDELRVDLTARYAGLSLPHPFGKASGQLSHTLPQVEADIEAGVAFIVLKTVIAEDSSGGRTMGAWKTGETRMKVERRASATGREGWTVTWKGRGWGGTLAEYLEFMKQALDAAREPDVPVIPSVKYHLPSVGEPFRTEEYAHTTGALLELWGRAGCGGDMILEKDFSPTLAGDDLAAQREAVLRWIADIPRLIPPGVRLGLKLMNTLFDDAFQVRMTRAAKAAFLVVYNRLYDPVRKTAYGGYDLSDRNLRVLDQLDRESFPPRCATGNICSGRMMAEYALRGCESGQVHTFFQLPLSEYTATGGERSARALHTLLLHPTEGLVAWLWHLNEAGKLEERDGVVRFLDLIDD